MRLLQISWVALQFRQDLPEMTIADFRLMTIIGMQRMPNAKKRPIKKGDAGNPLDEDPRHRPLGTAIERTFLEAHTTHAAHATHTTARHPAATTRVLLGQVGDQRL